MKRIIYIKHLKFYIILSILLFLFGFAGGYLFSQDFPEEAAKIIQGLKDEFEPAVEASGFELFLFIFLKNVSALVMTVALGIFMGIIPVLSVLSNGVILGVLAFFTAKNFSWAVFIAGILPHGIIELPVLFLSAAIGMRIGKIVLGKIFWGVISFIARRRVGHRENLKKEFKAAFRFFLTTLLPLLFLAALIETYVTPLFLPVKSVI